MRRTEGSIINPDDFRRERIPISNGIVNFLRTQDGKMLGEIIAFVRSQDPKPTKYTKMGILKILRKLIEDNRIIQESNKRYFVTQKVFADFPSQGQLFGVEASKLLLDDTLNFQVKGKERKFLHKIMKNIGLFYLYVYLKSWELVSKTKSFEENNKFRGDFIYHALPFRGFILAMESYMYKTTDPLGLFDESDRNTGGKTGLKINSKRSKELLKVLHRLSPHEMKELDTMWDELPTRTQIHKKYLDSVKSRVRNH